MAWGRFLKFEALKDWRGVLGAFFGLRGALVLGFPLISVVPA